ncbi:hypothetical protein WA158_002044 [Blastocystis sp. Blastoise]
MFIIEYYVKSVIDFFECYGIYFTVYPICGLLCIAGVLSPILNTYQGGCLFPYVSEVAKEGILYYPFLIGTSISLIPWSSMMYGFMKTNIQTFYLKVDNWFLRLIFRFMQHFIFMLQLSSCQCLFLASLFDIYRYPDFHGDVTTWVCAAANISFVVDYFINYFINRDLFYRQGKKKFLILIISWTSCLLFGTLNNIPNCSVEMLPMRECFLNTSFDTCIYGQDPLNPTMSLYRYYPHCPLIHWIRGFAEYLAVIFALMYINLMTNDSIYLNIYYYEQTGVCDNRFMWKYIRLYNNEYTQNNTLKQHRKQILSNSKPEKQHIKSE